MWKIVSGKPLIGGVLYSIVTAFILALIAAILFNFTPIPEMFLNVTALGIIAVSAFIGSFSGARYIKSKGLINGLLIGVIFFLIILGITFITAPGSITLSSFVKKFLTCLIAGACGGIIGVSS